jgi:hypothetical protein
LFWGFDSRKIGLGFARVSGQWKKLVETTHPLQALAFLANFVSAVLMMMMMMLLLSASDHDYGSKR